MTEHATLAPPSPEVLSTFARPERRIDGPDKVTGRTRYAGDKTLPGMLWGAFLGSPVPYGRIRSIDTSRARSMPGVHAVLSGADTDGARFGRTLLDQPVLCTDVVRFAGDRIAAVAAETLEQAEAALAAIEVDIEPLTPILDPDAALAEDAPILHPEAAAYTYLGPAGRPAVAHSNIQGRQARRRGAEDIEAIFAAAPHVFEHEYTTPRQHHGYMEPRGTMVWLDDDGRVNVVSTNKAPLKLRAQMAASLGLPPGQIVVDADAIGGDFGGKGYSVDEYACYFLARATGRPVKAVTRYADELTATNTRHAARLRLRTAVDEEGRLLAHQVRAVYDGGAYAAAKPMPHLTPNLGIATLTPYRVPNVDVEAVAVYTNTVPGGHMRAPGEVQSIFAGESQLDEIARALGIDRMELRLRNVIRDDEDQGALGDRFHGPKAAAAFERLRTELDWDSPLPDGHGRGVALCAMHVGASGPANLGLRLGADGIVEIVTGFPEQGGGQHEMLRRVLAAAASISEERIRVVRRTTLDAPLDPGVGGSWVTQMGGGAAARLGETLREWVDERIPRALPDAPGGAELRDDALIDPATGAVLLDFDELASRLIPAGETVELAASYSVTPHAPGEPGYADFAAFGVQVAVDRETGSIQLEEAVLVADVGVVINPVAHAGQLEGAFAFGVGAALMEGLTLEGGVVVGPSLAETKLPTTRDVPNLRIVLLSEPTGPGVFGTKSSGELSNSQIAPAIANAVADAVGARVRDLPLTPERVLAALRANGASS